MSDIGTADYLNLRYVTTGYLLVPAGSYHEYKYTAPRGYSLMSWGVNNLAQGQRIYRATIVFDSSTEGSVPEFQGRVENDDIENAHDFIWTFVLMKWPATEAAIRLTLPATLQFS